MDLFYLFYGKFSCKNNSGNSESVKKLYFFDIPVIALGAYMNRNTDIFFHNPFKQTEVLNNYCINSDTIKLFDQFDRLLQFIVVQYGINGNKDFDPVFMCVIYYFFNIFNTVWGIFSGTEISGSHIYGISTAVYGFNCGIFVFCWCKKFGEQIYLLSLYKYHIIKHSLC